MSDRFDEIARSLFHDVLASAQESSAVPMIAKALRDAAAEERATCLAMLERHCHALHDLSISLGGTAGLIRARGGKGT